MSREWLAVSSFTDTIPRSDSSDFLQQRSQARGREIVNAIVTPPVQWGESIPSCSIPRAPSDTEPRPLDLPPSRFPFRHLSTPPVISSCRYLNTLQHPDNARRHVSFPTTRTKTAVDAAFCIVAVVIPPPRIRYVGITSSRGGSKGRGEKGRIRKKPRPRWCRARADRWGVKPPIKRPLVSARRTGDISISSIGLKLLVTSRVFREQRGTDQKG